MLNFETPFRVIIKEGKLLLVCRCNAILPDGLCPSDTKRSPCVALAVSLPTSGNHMTCLECVYQDNICSHLTHCGRVTHICSVEISIIGSDNGLSPGRRQAIIWTSASILLIGLLGTNFIGISIGIETFSFKKMHSNMSSAKWRPFCPGLNVLRRWHISGYLVIDDRGLFSLMMVP